MLKVYNTLSRKLETFKPIKDKQVGIYSCGPTVYNYAHIGNLRTYIFNDLVKRSLELLGYKVNHVMNITDVDDKTLKGSIKEHLPLSEFTQKYEKIFFQDLDALNIIKPNHLLRATENIKEMVSLIKELLDKGYAYKASDGIYFSIDKSKNYGKLAQLEKRKDSKERIKNDEYDKTNPQDFALWKFYTPEDGDVFWETEIGKGRPGWHIECSAMSMKVLGPQIDIHTGGIDLIFPHHTNEIAQSEATTGKQFVKYWIHGGFLTMKEGKMSKSLGNVYTLKDIQQKGFSPKVYRYLCLTTHYRSPLQFTDENLENARNTYDRLKRKIIELNKDNSKSKEIKNSFESEFKKAIENDFNIPAVLQVLWKVLDSDLPSQQKLALLYKFDEVLGLNIKDMKEEEIVIPENIKTLTEQREQYRKSKKWKESDEVRDKIKQLGYKIEDSPDGIKISKI